MKMLLHDCLDHGIGLAVEGRLTEAIAFYKHSLEDYPGNAAILNNLANVLQAAGWFAESNAIYLKLLQSTKKPLAWRIASNYLAGLQYQVECPDDMLKRVTVGLGAQFGVAEMLPVKPVYQLPLRIGFIGADLCDHPVGLFLLPWLQYLDRSRFAPFLYSTGGRDDSTSRTLRAIAEWHDVAELDHDSLLVRLRSDALDVLVDLSGHTAGNRLPVFARRAALLQISWLGYFATTGIPAMDAVLMDSWHVPAGLEDQFVESVIRLPNGRFCYQPVPFAPDVSPSPCLALGYVTFGSFNNTAKYNTGVFAIWARILTDMQNSRLVLKWRTLIDALYREQVWTVFEKLGISRDRVELREASSHVDLLKQYADIDIALDPFPFTGGLTSCEALWMGVPVVTWPHSRAVSRQTFAFLSAIGLPELAAQNAEDYVRIAVELAGDRERLASLRSGMRTRMQASPLMDVPGFTRQLEQCLIELYQRRLTGHLTLEHDSLPGW